MASAPRKIHRRRSGELSVEQTHDRAVITAMLDRAVTAVRGLGQTAECFLIAYLGDEPVGIAGLETEVDAALMLPLFVAENMRCHGVGTCLLAAVRLAAHTRGARTLYTAVPTTSFGFFARFGFEETGPAELFKAFGHASMLQQMHLDNLAGFTAVRMDLSGYGLVER
jgi:N-acetylglutamate synthase-like GNAT family acetyltransferase